MLMRLSVEQEGFHQTLESLRVRNDFYVDEVQPVIARIPEQKARASSRDSRLPSGKGCSAPLSIAPTSCTLSLLKVVQSLSCHAHRTFRSGKDGSTQMRSSSSLRQKR